MSEQSTETAQWQGVGPTVTFEVWRSGPGKGPDVRIFSDRTTPEAVQDALDICLADKADGYPDAPVEFYVVRVTRTREVVTPTAKGADDA